MSRRKKRRKQEEEHMDESWLVPYADILTLLLALFIVLFAASSIDAQKFQQIASSFNNVLDGGSSIMEYQAPKQPELESLPIVEEEKKPLEEKSDKQKDKEELEELQRKINKYIKQNKLDDALQTKLTEEGLLVTLQDGALFDSASAKVRAEDAELAREISELLVLNPPRKIIISGHTDNVPINNHEFESNWHLSVMRSVNFMKILLENEKLNPSYFSARGLGEYEPIATNETVEGRAKNRRVEILILPHADLQP
ncbi:flagellar motor protein MotB [Thalassobacillus pellis]|uniref:flagellar motor protein MotB n=1 Tax=Thalassobacillus pellis TaxID=748008 RepID=UPI001960DC23|nr:flagellar motor protein MotB [Thalassobacillus pellis]MBM7551353.1 chemotaxis protein MotB [Thalassobacillus pellis]